MYAPGTPPARLWAPLLLLALDGCGVVERAAQTNTSRCQRLAEKLVECPALFGDGVEETFLADPDARAAAAPLAQPAGDADRSALAATAAAAAEDSLEVQACAFRVGGSSPACHSAFAALVDCTAAPSCAQLAARCAQPLAATKAACSALFVQ